MQAEADFSLRFHGRLAIDLIRQFLSQQSLCINHLLQLNQRAMLAKSEDAASVAQLWFYRTLTFAGILVTAGIFLAFFLANRIVEPLRQAW